MTHKILAAATLMLVTTAAAWADSTEGVPNIKTPEPEKVEVQMEESMEDIREYSVEQKNEAMQVARHALDDLHQQMTLLQADIDSQWQELSQDARLQKQEALSALKQEQKELEASYQSMQEAGKENWDAAKQQFHESWAAAKQNWRALTADNES